MLCVKYKLKKIIFFLFNIKSTIQSKKKINKIHYVTCTNTIKEDPRHNTRSPLVHCKTAGKMKQKNPSVEKP